MSARLQSELTFLASDLRLQTSSLSARSISIRTRNGRQLAVITLDVHGDFRWGWVEHPSGTGRRQHYSWSAFVKAITHRAKNGVGL